MAVEKFSKEIETNICIKRLSGCKQKDIAEKYGCSVDRVLAVQKRNPILMKTFSKNDDGTWGVDGKSLKINATLVFEKYELTGDEKDGVLYVQEIIRVDGEHDAMQIDYEDTDIGVQATLRVGKIVSKMGSHFGIIPNLSIDKGLIFDYTQPKVTLIEKPKIEINVDNVPKEVKEVVEKTKKQVLAKPTTLPKIAEANEEFIWTASNKFITISKGRDSWNADSSHENFKAALAELAKDNIEKALELINIKKAITEYVKGNIDIKNGVLKYGGYVLKNGIAKRIIERMRAGEDFEFFIPFLDNLMENPSERAVNRLFEFLEANDIEITADGYFIAWKKVGSEYLDLYTGKMDNSPGKEVKVPRNQVDEDDTVTCSRGLHVCSKSYLKSYGNAQGNRVVSVKVHPRDVVAIPKDYANAKMRTCGYKVMADMTNKV